MQDKTELQQRARFAEAVKYYPSPDRYLPPDPEAIREAFIKYHLEQYDLLMATTKMGDNRKQPYRGQLKAQANVHYFMVIKWQEIIFAK